MDSLDYDNLIKDNIETEEEIVNDVSENDSVAPSDDFDDDIDYGYREFDRNKQESRFKNRDRVRYKGAGIVLVVSAVVSTLVSTISCLVINNSCAKNKPDEKEESLTSGILVASDGDNKHKVEEIIETEVSSTAETTNSKETPELSNTTIITTTETTQQIEVKQVKEEYKSFDFNHGSNCQKTKDYINSHERVARCVEENCKKYGFDYNLAMAIIMQESKGKHDDYLDIDNENKIGIFQIPKRFIGETISVKHYDKETGKTEIREITITEDNVKSSESNIEIGIIILKKLLEKYNYNLPLALQANNYGTDLMDTIIINYAGSSEKKQAVIDTPNDLGWVDYCCLYEDILNGFDSNYIKNVLQYYGHFGDDINVNGDTEIQFVNSNGVIIYYTINDLKNIYS